MPEIERTTAKQYHHPPKPATVEHSAMSTKHRYLDDFPDMDFTEIDKILFPDFTEIDRILFPERPGESL